MSVFVNVSHITLMKVTTLPSVQEANIRRFLFKVTIINIGFFSSRKLKINIVSDTCDSPSNFCWRHYGSLNAELCPEVKPTNRPGSELRTKPRTVFLLFKGKFVFCKEYQANLEGEKFLKKCEKHMCKDCLIKIFNCQFC